MSKIATSGAFGRSFFEALIPSRFGGLWRGASGISFLIVSRTFGVIFVACQNFSPPWTTRWPTASISERSSMTLLLRRREVPNLKAVWWLLICLQSSFPCELLYSQSGRPMPSMWPL